jgi:2-hydroxy-3-oxopropionate reductase
MLDLEGPKMAERNFAAGIEARLHDKDFGLVREIAQELGLQMPAMELVASQLNTLVANGWGYDDTASLLRVLEQQNNHHTD